MSWKRGFTLVELLVVIAIIGILATIVTYGAYHVQTEARDTTRKSDLTAISEGFIARYQDKTCSGANAGNINEYPNAKNQDGSSTAANVWIPVDQLNIANNEQNPCDGSFVPSYLSRIPSDPQSSKGWTYIFSVTSDESHFRLAASLENASTNDTDCTTALNSWETLFGGSKNIDSSVQYGSNGFCNNNGSRGYNYIIGQ